jgi:4-amino-4-deoxy-L-arabinose transferase-like glycosyltransferase
MMSVRSSLGRTPLMSQSITPLSAWPTALVPYLRRLWTHVLFPDLQITDSRLRLCNLAILLLLPAALLYPCMTFHLLEPDEGRYAEIPREMLARGDWVVPRLQGEPYLDKPPLLYWLVMVSYRVFGVHDWAARLIPALAVHGTILLSYIFGRRLLGERAAFRGALLLTLTPGLMGMGRILTLDSLLTFWVTLAVFAGWRGLPARSASEGGRPPLARASGWSVVSALACGLGVLTKGPVTILLVIPPFLIHRWLLTGTLLLRWKSMVAFTSIILAVNLPWYVAVWIEQPEFGGYFFLQHNLQRFLAPFDHLEPIWYYGPVMLAGLLPGALLLPGFVRWLASGHPHGRTPELGFVLLAGGWCVFFFSLSGCKLPTYILPAFAPLSLALGAYWVRAKCGFGKGGAILWGWTATLAVSAYVLLPWYAEYRSPMGAPAAALRQACAENPAAALRCYPRPCDSVAFYLNRGDVPSTRSKFVHLFIHDLLSRERTIVLLTHNHSLEALKHALPPELRIVHEESFRQRLPGPAFVTRLVGDTPWGLCHLAVVENTAPPRPGG